VRHRTITFLLASMWLGVAQATVADGPAATQSAAQLRAGLLQRHRSIRSFYVEYRCYDYPVEEGFPPETYVHRIVAAKAPYYYFHHNSHGYKDVDWRDDYLQQTTYVTGTAYSTQYSIERRYSTAPCKPNDPLPGSMPFELFLGATGLWPMDDRPPSKFEGEPYMLCEISASDAYSRVRPNQELCEGHWCHVLERPGYASLWIAPELGFAVTAREEYNRANGAAIERLELLGHREVRPGIWMPTRIRNMQYDHNSSTPSGRLRKTNDATMQLDVVRVNDVETALFEYSPPPGAYRLEPRPRGQTVPGGQDLIEELARWTTKKLQASRRVDPSIPTRANGLDASYLPVCAAAVLIILLEFQLHRRRASLARLVDP
jgi:hypothetical protein